MRLRGRQARFIVATIGGWSAWRVWMLWPIAATMIARDDVAPPLPLPASAPAVVFASAPVARTLRRSTQSRVAPMIAASSSFTAIDPPPRGRALLAFRDGGDFTPQRLLRRASFLQAAPSPPPTFAASLPAKQRRIEASAYLFARPGGGSGALAPGGTLGGSQAAVRIAYTLDDAGRIAVAARAYAPLRGRGAEAAAGLDWHPLPRVPLRFSIERRIGLDRAGRDAWSAYAAGGFYTETHGLALDGYGQAGLVGAQRRDLFVDGALRAGRRVGALTLGAGVWGAAQPGAARLDAGPRAALGLPLADHRLTLALEGRLRIAGRAAPGSGVALTLAADF